jgi:hypothetical protein
MSAEFEPANSLEVALKKAVTEPSAYPLFLRELLQSKVVIVPVGPQPAAIGAVVPANTAIALGTIAFAGRKCVPFFTSEARLPTGTEYLRLDAKTFFELTRGTHLVMNPGSDYGKEFCPEEITGLLGPDPPPSP